MEEGEVQLNKVYGDPMVLLYRTQSTKAVPDMEPSYNLRKIRWMVSAPLICCIPPDKILPAEVNERPT
jgi:hypothetical protein